MAFGLYSAQQIHQHYPDMLCGLLAMYMAVSKSLSDLGTETIHDQAWACRTSCEQCMCEAIYTGKAIVHGA